MLGYNPIKFLLRPEPVLGLFFSLKFSLTIATYSFMVSTQIRKGKISKP